MGRRSRWIGVLLTATVALAASGCDLLGATPAPTATPTPALSGTPALSSTLAPIVQSYLKGMARADVQLSGTGKGTLTTQVPSKATATITWTGTIKYNAGDIEIYRMFTPETGASFFNETIVVGDKQYVATSTGWKKSAAPTAPSARIGEIAPLFVKGRPLVDVGKEERDGEILHKLQFWDGPEVEPSVMAIDTTSYRDCTIEAWIWVTAGGTPVVFSYEMHYKSTVSGVDADNTMLAEWTFTKHSGVRVAAPKS